MRMLRVVVLWVLGSVLLAGSLARAESVQAPLTFVPNSGETDARVRYYARTAGASFYFTPSEAVFALKKERQGISLHMAFLGANRKPGLEGIESRPGTVNHLIGSDRARWRTGVPTYGGVVYRNLWPGIDLAFRGEAGAIKYEFHVAPGADPGDIRLAYRGAEQLGLDPNGELLIHTALGVLRDGRPVSYQVVNGERVAVESHYTVETSEYAFALGDYDTTRTLVIDPSLVYSTYLGGSHNDFPFDMAVDEFGNVYVTGSALSQNFPTTPGVFDTSYNGGVDDVFVAKLDPTGSTLLWSTYIGGISQDRDARLALDAEGNVYVTGLTLSTNFPTTPGAFDTILNNGDAFVFKLDPTGSTLLYSTLLGGMFNEAGTAIAVDAAGSAYVTGFTNSTNFPTTVGAFDRIGGDNAGDGFVAKLDATGSTLVYSTFLGGGGGSDGGIAIKVDDTGSAYVAGTAGANSQGTSTFPTTVGAFDRTFNGDAFGRDGFVARLDPAGATLLYSTFLGGGGDDDLNDLALDAAGNVYVTGSTVSLNFPTTPGAFQLTRAGTADAFVSKLDAAGATLLFSTYLGGATGDSGIGIAVDSLGRVHVTGGTSSIDFPLTVDAVDPLFTSGEAYMTSLDPTGATLEYSTYLGGDRNDSGLTIAVDQANNVYVAGFAFSTNFPTTPGAYRRFNAGVDFTDAFIAKFEMARIPATLVLTPPDDLSPVGTMHTVTASVADAHGQPVADVEVLFTVTGTVNIPDFCVTDSAGRCEFRYTGPTSPGIDSISAFVDANDNNVQDGTEPGATAAKVWVAGPAASLALAPPSNTSPVATEHCVTATVSDAFANRVTGATVRFAVNDSGSTGSGVTDANGLTNFCYLGPDVAGTDEITAFADTNANNVQDGNEPGATAVKVWVSGPAATLALAPPSNTSLVATEHCVTATVSDAFANRLAGTTVRFMVSDSGSTGSGVTDANGLTNFCYLGPDVAGTDEINAFADVDGDGAAGAGEPTATATQTWEAPPDPPTQDVEVIGAGAAPGALPKSAVGFALFAKSRDGELLGNCLVIDPAAHVVLVCRDVTSLTRAGTRASISGNATMNGAPALYQIEVDDAGFPGRNVDTFRITTSGYQGGGLLKLGDVRIR